MQKDLLGGGASGVPKPLQGKVDVALDQGGGTARRSGPRPSEEGEEDSAQRAVTHYSVIDKAPPVIAWVSLKPVDRPPAPTARPYGAYRPPDRRR